jgi:hypothetical protein
LSSRGAAILSLRNYLRRSEDEVAGAPRADAHRGEGLHWIAAVLLVLFVGISLRPSVAYSLLAFLKSLTIIGASGFVHNRRDFISQSHLLDVLEPKLRTQPEVVTLTYNTPSSIRALAFAISTALTGK